MLFRKVTNIFSENKSCYSKDQNGLVVKRDKLDIFRTICEWKVVSKNQEAKKIRICYRNEDSKKEEKSKKKKDDESDKNQDDYENNDKEDNIL